MKKRTTLLVLGALVLGACGAIWTPYNRSHQQNTDPINGLMGFTTVSGDTISFSATNRNTGSSDNITPSPAWTASTSWFQYMGSNSNVFQWPSSLTLTLTPAPQYWAPQSVTIGGTSRQPNGLATSIGRLELVASDSSGSFSTFSYTAEQCVQAKLAGGASLLTAGEDCYDGTSLVVFDANGVGVGAIQSSWTPVCCGSSNCDTKCGGSTCPACAWQDNSQSDVKWHIGYYQSQKIGSASPYNIYAMVCQPAGSGNDDAMIINHGGYVLDNAQEQFCLWGASLGYTTAMSTYRGEPIALGPNWPYPFPYTGAPLYKQSDGNVELCLGEAVDSMELTSVVQSTWDITPQNTVMWGHSHGACVTERAVEAGVKVSAAAAFDAPTDFYNWYTYCAAGSLCDAPAPTPTLCTANAQCPSGTCFDYYCTCTTNTDCPWTGWSCVDDYCALPGNVEGGIACSLGYGSGSSPNCTYGGLAGYPNLTSIAPSDSRIPYDWRSPATYASDLGARTDVAMLLMQGNSDTLIEPAQACELTYKAWNGSSTNVYYDVNHNVYVVGGVAQVPGGAGDSGYGVPTACGGSNDALTWQTSWPNWSTGKPYLVVYDGQTHTSIVEPSGGIFNPAIGTPWNDFKGWLNYWFG